MISFRLFGPFLAIATAAASSAATAADIRGTMDGVKDGRISGWALDPASPAAPLTVFVYKDGPKGTGELVSSAPTVDLRPDVNAAQGASGAHGFSWQIPAADRQQLHLWYVYAGATSDSAEQIRNSPGLYPAVTATSVGTPQAVFTYATDKCSPEDIPDHPARAYHDAAGNAVLIASHYNVRRAVGPTLDSVAHQCAVVFQSGNDPKFGDFKFREWLHAVYTPDGKTVYGLMHSEWYARLEDSKCGNDDIDGWADALLLAVSKDGGASFSQPQDDFVRRPATRWDNSFPCNPGNPTRYGDFGGSNIVMKDGYYYKLAVWSTEPAVAPHRIGDCLIRSRTLGDASSWEIWTGSGYARSETGPCAFLANVDNLTSISYNTYLKLYVGTEYIRSRGFFFAVSPNLIDWSRPMPLATPGIDVGNTPYPSLLDPKDTSRNFERSGRSPDLYYTVIHAGLDRDLMRVQIQFAGLPGG